MITGAPGTFPLEFLTEEAGAILTHVQNLSHIRGVEVGTLRGKTAAILLHRRPGLMLTCVDNWSLNEVAIDDTPAQVFAAFERNIAPHRHRVQVLDMDSIEGATTLTATDGAVFDFIYIDAQHTYDAALADIRAYWPLVRSGGFLMGHDYGRKGPNGEDHAWEVQRAVETFRRGAGLGLPLHRVEATTWSIRKP